MFGDCDDRYARFADDRVYYDLVMTNDRQCIVLGYLIEERYAWNWFIAFFSSLVFVLVVPRWLCACTIYFFEY